MRVAAGVLRRLNSYSLPSLLALLASSAVVLLRTRTALGASLPSAEAEVAEAVPVIGGPTPTLPSIASGLTPPSPPATPPLCIDTPPATGTLTPPHHTPSFVTCYTCVNVPDNEICNRFAIDRPCPAGKEFCHTLHIMDSRGKSVIVNKKCADSDECEHRNVGCLVIDMQTVCTSCCDEMYCNETVPSNQTTVFYNRTRVRPTLATAVPSAASSTTLRQDFISVLGCLRTISLLVSALLMNRELVRFTAVVTSP